MIVGRSRELAVLTAVVGDRARAEAVLLGGGAGAGKTALLEAAASTAHRAGRRVWRASFDASSAMSPLSFLTRALKDGGYAIGDLVASIRAAGAAGRIGPAGLPQEVVVDVLDLLEGAGSEDGAILIVDDLHHAPPAAIALLASIAKRRADLRVTLLLAARTDELDGALAPLVTELRTGGQTVLELAPLDDDEVADLVAQRFGAPPDDALRARCAIADGNPLLLIELLAAMQRAATLQIADGLLRCERDDGPTALSSLALRRLVDVPQPTVELLRTAAVLGRRFRIDELRAVAALTTARIAALLQPAIDRGVIRAVGEDFEFGYELIRRALYDALTPGLRAATHRDVAERLRADGAEAATVALHLLVGTQASSPGGQAQLVARAREYATVAPGVAADLLERARALTTDPSERDQLGSELAPLLLIAGRQAEAEAVCRDVLAASHDPRHAAGLRPTLARALFARGAPAEAVQILRRALSDETMDPVARVRLSGEGAFQAVSSGLLADGLALAAETLRLDADTPDDVGGVAALCAHSVACGAGGQFAAGLQATETAMIRARRSPGWETEQYLPGWFHANSLMNLDRLDEARAAIRRTSEFVRHWSMRFGGPASAMADSWIDWYQGRLADSAARAEAGLDEADESGVTIASCQHNCVLTVVTLELNDIAAARRYLDRAAAFAADGSTMFGVDWLPWLHGLVLEAEGDAAAAAAVATAGWRELHDMGDLWPLRLMAPDAVRICVAAGRLDDAAQISADMAGIADTMGSASAQAAALRTAALLTGDPEVAQHAVEAAHRSGRVLEEAHACIEAGDVALAATDRDIAAGRYERAATLAATSGARRMELRAAQGLRAAGQRSGARGPRARPETGWASLSPTELKVTALVSEGLRNQAIADRLFISRRTVETHLKHIFTKLDVTSRTQLVATAVAHRG